MALILSRDDVMAVLTMKDAIEAVETAFRELAEGSVDMPVRLTVRIPEPKGIVNVMPAYLGRSGALGLKLVSAYAENPKRFNIPSVQATILYSDYRSGQLLAVMEGGYITAVRTGAASGVATKYLARKDSAIVGVIGAGVQAETQLEAVCAVLPVKFARVYGPTPVRRAAFAEKMSRRLGIEVKQVGDAEEAARRCDIVITATSSKDPVLRGEWLSPGTHVNGIGSHAPDYRELDEVVIKRSKVVVDSMEAATKEAGDLLIPMASGIIPKDHIYAELGELVVGKKPGRVRSEEITLFKSQGLAIEDVVTAKLVYERAKSRGIGKEQPL